MRRTPQPIRRILRGLVHGLLTVFADALRRLDTVDQRLADPPDAFDAPGALGAETPPAAASHESGPPAHWLEAAHGSGPPAHWLEDIRRRAADPNRVETFDVTVPERGDLDDRSSAQDGASTNLAMGDMKPPEGSTSDEGEKRGVVRADRSGVTFPPEGSASNTRMNDGAKIKASTTRLEVEASAGSRRDAMNHASPEAEASAGTEGATSNEGVKRGVVRADRSGVTFPPEGSASNTRMNDGARITASTMRPEAEASAGTRRDATFPPEGSTSNTRMNHGAKIKASTTRPAAEASAGSRRDATFPPEGSTSNTRMNHGARITAPTTRPEAETLAGTPRGATFPRKGSTSNTRINGGARIKASITRPEAEASAGIRRPTPITAAPPNSRLQPIVAVTRSTEIRRPMHPPPSAPLTPVIPAPNIWPELLPTQWVDDADDASRSDQTHLQRLAREQEGSR